MAIKLANIAMPTTMSARALRYNFTPNEIIGRNGKGEAIVSNNGASVEWTWASLNATEYDWLITTLLGDAASKEDSTSSGTIVYNHKRAEQTFNHCMILRPEYKMLRGVEYVEVTLLIDQLW
jgi:hypothetical protein